MTVYLRRSPMLLLCLRRSEHLRKRSPMIIYLRRRPLLLFSVVQTKIPLCLPLRNVVHKSSIHRWSTAASIPLVSAKATEGAGAWLLLWSRCCTVAVVLLLPAKAREGAGAWLLLRPQRCTVAAVVVLLPAKAREGAGVWLVLRPRCCTVAAAMVSHEQFRTASAPLIPAKATEGAGLLPLLPQRCTFAAAVVSNERFRTITMTTAVRRRRPRDTRRAHLRLVPGSSASLVPDSRSRAAVMWPQLLWLRAKQMLRWGMTVVLLINFHRLGCFVSLKKKTYLVQRCFRSRRPCPSTSAFAVYKSLE